MRLIRKWKVKSAAWAGVAACLVAGPLAYALVGSGEAGSPALPVVVRDLARDTGPRRVDRSPPGAAPDLAALERIARSEASSLRARTEAVAQLGQMPAAEAVAVLTSLAGEQRRQGDQPNVVSLAALHALWARGEQELVSELAARSPDPAVKSKAIALARAK
jgi:hypothetical protein